MPELINMKRSLVENPPTQPYSPCVSVVDLFANQAAIRGDAVALIGEKQLTYSQLNTQSNQLAYFLRSLGVGSSSLVAINMPRSVELIVSALAVLKAGGSYLPLDPGNPRDRLAFMLDDAKVSVLLTHSNLAKRLPPGAWNTVDMDEAPHSSYPSNEVHSNVVGTDRAYVIYTSGSTGRPKGVEITHASLLNLVLWHQQAFDVVSSDRATQFASPGFDAAVWEVWPYLTAGCSIHVAGDVVRSDAELLRDWLVAERITLSFVPTPLAERLLTLEWPSTTALRLLLTGGDTLHFCPPVNLPFKLVNNYGPTECTVVASSGFVSPGESTSALPSIGRPIANTEIYILDGEMKEMAVGMDGEIFIGGAGLARGYLNHPELTAERFVANPFCETLDTSRLYKTGDLGRYLPDGRIAFVGRSDQQIKIRGYRIEPNEIVAALDNHPDVLQSQVIATAGGNNNKSLVAYIVPKAGSQLSAHDLRAFLIKNLPEYMVPSQFVRLEALPLTSNGKVDSTKLPVPNAANILADEVLTTARTAVEEQVTIIVARLLGLAHLSIHDNFFLLGGHSLLGTQVIGRVRETFGVELPLHRLFESPTIADLAAEVDRLLIAQVQAVSEDEARRILDSLPSDNIGDQ
jgi:amino acid adenylation domain-containing protein